MIDSPHQATDSEWMDQALVLANFGMFSTSPNPRVGCVLVKDGALVGSGWHQQAGGDHAEVVALKEAGKAAHGATAYITLEPCNHHGRTPPCTEALIKAGIAHAVVAIEDPDPRTAGMGIARLTEAGINVRLGVGANRAHELNIGFIHRQQTGRPWLRLKLAASLDGRATGPDGHSQWITSEKARADGHSWRARACAVLTGINTILADDPLLTARLENTSQPIKQPIRVILDSHGKVPNHAKIFESNGPIWVISTVKWPGWFDALSSDWVQWHQLGADACGRIHLEELVHWLGQQELNEVHIEAGPTLSGAFLASGFIDEVLLYQAPTFLGEGKPMVALPKIERLDQGMHMTCVDVTQIGPDQRLRLRWFDHHELVQTK